MSFPLLLPLRFDLHGRDPGIADPLSRGSGWSACRLAVRRHRARTRRKTRPGADAQNAWHGCTSHAPGTGSDVEVDGQNVPVRPDTDVVTEWLMIEPAPDETVTLRNLVVTW